ncbi:MAG: PrgI family protein [Patescibacteria group bacterium]
MRFQVPQFIDVEDKIFGPFTLKQFIYLAGGGAVAVASVTLLGVFWGLTVSSPIIILALALAFYKINNRPFIYTLEAAFKYLMANKLYIWKKKEDAPVKNPEGEEEKYSSLIVPNLSQSKLKDLNWELDVKKKEGEKTTV